MRTKQFLALLLACLLLMGTACAVAPTPKREPGTGAQEETAPENAGEVYAPHAVPHHDMDEEAAPLPADEADADGEAEPATSDEADTPFLREVFTGSFAIDENGNETVYDLFLEMATYAQYYTLAFNAKPAGGEGIALDASLRIAEAIWAVEQIAYGQLDVIDAASGALFARYTLSLGRDWNLVISDVLGNRSVETMLGEQAERAISLAFETVGLMETVDGFTPLAAKFSGLESGGTLRLSVRELLLPLVQMLYNPRLDAYVGADEREMLSALLSEMRGAFTLFPPMRACNLPITAKAARNFRATRPKGMWTKTACGASYTKTAMAICAAVGRFDVDVRDGLSVRVEDYVGGGFIYLDAWLAHSRYFNAALSCDLDGSGDVTHVLLNYAENCIDAETSALEHEISLRIAEGGDITTYTLAFTHDSYYDSEPALEE